MAGFIWDNLLNQVVKIQRATVTVTATGETTRAWVTIATDVKAAIQHPRPFGGKVQAAAGQEIETEWFAFLPFGTDVKEGDRVVEGTRTFDVMFVETVRANHMELKLRIVNVT